MKNVQKGFTLIELMIVVAIIAILAAIAIPQYQTYVIRSQVARLMGEAGDAKVVVEDCINNGKTQTTCDLSTITPSDVVDPTIGAVQGTEAAPTNGGGYPQVTINTDGSANIVGTLGGHASTKVAGGTVTWTRTTDGAWSCATDSSKVGTKYAPASCQPTAAAGGTGG